MLLAIDIGNTNITLGLYRGEELQSSWRISTRQTATADELASVLIGLFAAQSVLAADIDAVVAASVVPLLTPAVQEMARRYFGLEAMVIGPGVRSKIRILYDNPREVGADRIANAAAVAHKYGGPAIVVDFGTSVNYDVINGNGDFIGGVLAPGLESSLDALVAQAARLHRVDLVAPAKVIGKSTVASLQSGLMWGVVAQVEGLVARIRSELGEQAKVIATGGQAAVVASLTPVIQYVDPQLTLEGLRLIWQQNQIGG